MINADLLNTIRKHDYQIFYRCRFCEHENRLSLSNSAGAAADVTFLAVTTSGLYNYVTSRIEGPTQSVIISS